MLYNLLVYITRDIQKMLVRARAIASAAAVDMTHVFGIVKRGRADAAALEARQRRARRKHLAQWVTRHWKSFVKLRQGLRSAERYHAAVILCKCVQLWRVHALRSRALRRISAYSMVRTFSL